MQKRSEATADVREARISTGTAVFLQRDALLCALSVLDTVVDDSRSVPDGIEQAHGELKSMVERTNITHIYRYDAFISYSHRDKEWVHGVLLRSLEREGLTVCIDTRDFEIGVPSLVNMENAVQQSRKTLLVLTPDWVASEWTDFEALLIQTKDPVGRSRRMLPLMVRDCRLPDRLSIFTYLDLRSPVDVDSQMHRLVEAIRGTEEATSPSFGSDADPVQTPHPAAPRSSQSYEQDLARLGELLSGADAATMLNFAVLEAKLHENLRSEVSLGSTKILLDERAHLVHELDRIALAWSGRHFSGPSG